MLWVEKYRPETFDEIVGNREIINEIESSVDSGEMPHMAFFGPAGVGKTTAATVVARETYGDVSDTSFMELNASDERGINVIRNKVKKFAGRKSLSGDYKIVFLDESDSLTSDAQQSLRRIMEQYHESCRFILTGNYKHKLIKPLLSRCTVFDFKPISQPECLRALENVSEKEDLDIDGEVLDKLTKIYDGDLRQQIGKLQSLSNRGSLDAESLESGEEYIQLFNYMAEPNYMAAVRTANKETMSRLYNYLMQKESIPGRVKADVSIIFAKYMWRLDRSADEKIQLNAMVAELIKELREHIQ